MFHKLLLFLLLFLFLIPHRAYADNKNFDISEKAVFSVSEDGNTKVVETITIKNKQEFIVTPTYTALLGYKNITNIKVVSSQANLKYTVLDDTQKGKEIEISFPRRIVGVGKESIFTISFETTDVAKRVGNLWEINILGISAPDDFSFYQLSLSVPESFGSLSISKPYKFIHDNTSNFTFNKGDIGKSGIYLVFGSNQYYNLKLSYHVTNSNFFPYTTEVALPPDTTYQEVLVNNITPKPLSVYQDVDGNWLAQYKLAGSQKLNVMADILVKVYPGPKYSENISSKKANLVAEKYWNVGNLEIKNIAKNLKTPQEVYDFVIQKLSYNYNKVSDSNVRLGAVQALLRGNFAVCLEFTDLFIALARAAGIQSRAIEGFAYTQNEKLRPVSLVKDILHVWPEYYDEHSNSWIMVDPTWGNTTKGMDYFNTLDFNHIAFVINGQNSEYPIPAGGYKFDSNTKDVVVSFSTPNEFIKAYRTSLIANFPDIAIAGFSITGEVVIKNLGNYLIKDMSVIVSSSLSQEKSTYHIDYVPPFGEKRIRVVLGKSVFLTNKTVTVTISFDKTNIEQQISVRILPSKSQILTIGGIILAIIIIAFITIKAGGVYFQRRK